MALSLPHGYRHGCHAHRYAKHDSETMGHQLRTDDVCDVVGHDGGHDATVGHTGSIDLPRYRKKSLQGRQRYHTDVGIYGGLLADVGAI